MNGNKRIAVNTLFLYAKFIITTIVSLVLSRLVLQALGASDYGLYNVVGGIVVLLNTIGASMVSTSYRYMAVEFGKGEGGNPNKIYNTIFVVHLALAVFLIVIGETLGVYYIKNYLNVESYRVSDALFVFHLSLLTTSFAVITVPMNGLIVSREKFLFTAIVEVCAAIARLLLVILMMHIGGNKLRMYSVFMACVQFSIPMSYQIYCRCKDTAVVKWNLNRKISDYKDVLKFTWWICIGAVAVLGKMQGAAIIINYFFGTVLNAAFGLASQINNAVSSFTATISQAAVPQIMKSQSAGNEERSLSLVYIVARYSVLSMSIIAVPLLFCLDDVLKLWLGNNPPEYTNIYAFFMLINGLIANLDAGFDASIQATGRIKVNQIGYSLINLSLLPIIFCLYRIGCPPYINVVIMVMLTVFTLIFRVFIMLKITHFDLKKYMSVTVVPSILTIIMAVVPLIILTFIIGQSISSVLLFALSLFWTMVSVFIIGIRPQERAIIIQYVTKYIKK